MAAKDYDRRIKKLEHRAEIQKGRYEKPETPEERLYEDARFVANTLVAGAMLKKRMDSGCSLNAREKAELENAQWLANILNEANERGHSQST